MMFALANQMPMSPGEDPASYPAEGPGLGAFLRRFVAPPGSVLNNIDRYQYGPRSPSAPPRPYVTQSQVTPLSAVASDPEAAPGRPQWTHAEPFDNPGGSPRMPINPAVAAIRDGSGAAQQAAGEMRVGTYVEGETSPGFGAVQDLPGSGERSALDNFDPALIKAGEAVTAGTENPSLIQKMIERLSSQSEVSPQDRWMALARGAFGTAASRNPSFFGAVGEGGQIGLDAFEKSRSHAASNAARAAQLGLTELQRKEQERHNRSTETYRTEDIRSRAADRRDRREIERARLDETRRYHEAVNGRGDWVVVGQTKDGKPLYQNRHTNEEKVGQFEVSSLGSKGAQSGVYDRKLASLVKAGYSEKEATDIANGIRPMSRSDAERIATSVAKAATANMVGQRATEEFNRIRQEQLDLFGQQGGGGGGGAEPRPAAATGGIPKRPSGVPAGAQYSPSQKAYWWQEGGQWKSAPAE